MLHIRELYSKLLAMDKSGRAMLNSNTLGLYFDEVTKSVNRAGKGSKVSADYLTSLAEQDLPKALELLSKLYVSGEVTGATLKKIFSERHFNPIAVGLIQMNGDIDAFNKNLTTGYKVIDGYNLQMQSMTNQVELAKNNFSALKGVLFEGMKGGLLPFVLIINQMGTGLIEVNKQVPILSAALATTATYMGIIAGSSAIKHIFNYVLMLGRITPMVAGISVAISALVGGFSYLNKIKTDRLALISISDKNISDAEKFKEQAKSIGLEIDILNKSLSTLGTQNTTTALERQQEIWDRYAKSVGVSNGAMTELLKTLREISKIDPLKSMNEADIAKKKLNILESGKKSAESLVATSGETASSNIKFSIAERLLKPERENVALFTPKESDALTKALQDGNGKIDGTKLKWVNKIIEAQKLNAGESDIALARLVKGGATKQDFDLVSGLDKFAKSYNTTIEEILTTKNGKGYYGKELEAVITLNKSSQEYANYTQNIKTSASYDPKIEQTKLEYETYVTQELQKQVEVAQELKQLSKDKIMDLDVEDLKNIRNFKEYEKFLNKISGLDISKYISSDVYNKISNQTDFDTSKLSTAPVQGKIIDINETRQAVTETKKLLNQNYAKVKIRGLSDVEMKATKDAILSQESAIASSEELIKRLINTLGVDLLEVADKANKSLVSIDFKTIKSNVEELTNELASLGLKGLDALSFKFEALRKNFISNQNELLSSLVKNGGEGNIGFDEQKYLKIAQDTEKGGSKNRTPEEKDAYDNAIKQLETINALKELSIKYNIEIYKNKVDYKKEEYNQYAATSQMAQQLEAIKRIGKEKTLQNELDDIANESLDISRKKQAGILTDEMATVEYGKLDVKIAEAKYNAKMRENKATFDLFKTQQDMKTYGFELNAQQEYKNEMLLIQKQRSLDLITDKEKEVAEEKAQNDLIKARIDMNKKLYGDIASNIDKISKGEFSSTPSYDLSNTFGKMANSMEKGHGLFGKANLNGKDYAQITNFAITQFSNVWGTINQKHIESINNEITMLDMRKELATSDEERQRIDKEILDKRIEVIRLESQTKQQQSIMGGVTGGLTTIANNPTNPLSYISAGVQLVSGIFGASKADKQAKIQERQLKQQEAIRKATEYTAKFTEMSNNELKKLYASQSLGFDTALGILGKNLKADYKNVMGQSGSINTNISSALSQISKKSDFYTQNKDAWDKIGAPLNYTHTLTASDNYTKFTRELETSIGNLTPTSDFTKVKDDIQALRALWGGGANTGAKANPYIDALNIQLDAWENYINTLEKLSKKRDVFYSAYFGFDVSYIQDTSGKITDIMTGEWKKREDVMNHVVENAKSGANDITKYMGTYITDSIITAWTTNKNSLSVVLNTMETDIKSLFIYMSDVKNKNSSLSDLFKIDTKGKNSLLSPLIEDFKKLNSEQVEINKQSSYLVNAWITLGGAVSDVMSMLPQFSKDLFNGMSEALTQTTFLERFNTVAESISNSLVEKLKTKLMDDSLKSTFMDLNNSITEIMGKDDVTISDALSLRQKIEQSASNMERESQKIQSITDLLSMNKEVNYTSASSQIQYSSGSTTSNVVNMSNSIQIDASGIITMDKTDKVKFANEIAGEMLLALEKKTGRLSK